MTDDNEAAAPALAHVQDWMRSRVAIEVDELRDLEITAEHVSEIQRGVLAWFAEHYVNDDPQFLVFPDGPDDGGMDIVSITNSEQRNHVTVFQCSAPRPDRIAQGYLSTKKTKFADDIRQFITTVTGSARKLRSLNATAQGVLRSINKMREAAQQQEGPIPLTIEVKPLTLRLVHPDAKREIQELRDEVARVHSTASEQWIIHDVLGAPDLYQLHLRQKGKDTHPTELKLSLCGSLPRDHRERGPFLCFVRAHDLVQAYETWGAGLLESNLRYALGKSEVNKLIEGELEHPGAIKWFHEKNNGGVLICDSCHETNGQIRLTAPQIVNGGQTIHSIASVVREIQAIPKEAREKDQGLVLRGIQNDLKIPVRIVVVSGGKAQRPDDIAMASNTQNRLSERTMRSSSLLMRDLRFKLAGADVPWYVVTKDGEWSAVREKPRVVQSRTGNRQLADFKAGRRYRLADNTDLGIAMMAFLGFVQEAKSSRVFKPRYFDNLFGFRPAAGAWPTLATRRVEWAGADYSKLFEPGQPPTHLWLLAEILFSFWKTFTFPESRQLLMAYEEEGRRKPSFKSSYLKSSGWDVTEEAQAVLLASLDSCYWREQVAKSAYLVLVHQSMRVLFRCFGTLDDETCRRILRMKQLAGLLQGEPMESIGDFRDGSLADGPLTALGKILLYSCEIFWQGHEAKIRPMASRHQTLLQDDWVGRLSEKVDLVCDRLSNSTFRQLVDSSAGGGTFQSVEDIFRH
jgi:hypothetical protein